MEGKGRDSSGKLPLSDVTNSSLVHQLDPSKRHGVKKEQQTQLHSLKFDVFLTPEHQPFQTSWSTVFYTPDNHVDNSTHTPLSKRGCYVCRLSPTASIAALAVNSRDASNTAVVFFSPLVDAGMSASLYLSKTKDKTGRYIRMLESSKGQSFKIVNLGGTIPVSAHGHIHVYLCILWYLHEYYVVFIDEDTRKIFVPFPISSLNNLQYSFFGTSTNTFSLYFRSYWVSDMVWLADGLLLACMTKRGSLVILP